MHEKIAVGFLDPEPVVPHFPENGGRNYYFYEGECAMQIALTKRLSDALGVKPPNAQREVNPLFLWTANWTNVWADEAEDTLVLINNATRFVVAIHPLRRQDLKEVPDLMGEAIKNTLLSFDLNPKMVREYFRLAGEVELVRNTDRRAAAWVTKAGLECAFLIGRDYDNVEKISGDTAGRAANYLIVDSPEKGGEPYHPYSKMGELLSELTGIKPRDYRAFELAISLDLQIYRAERRLIVPADVGFYRLHRLLQKVFAWEDAHLYDFRVLAEDPHQPIIRLVPFEDDLEYDPQAILLNDQKLATYFPKYRSIIYTYDFGDNWEHTIRLVRVLEGYEEESPYLLEASGAAPPEDVGGIPGFLHFREVFLDKNHPEHQELKKWAGRWSPELSVWEKRPRVISA